MYIARVAVVGGGGGGGGGGGSRRRRRRSVYGCSRVFDRISDHKRPKKASPSVPYRHTVRFNKYFAVYGIQDGDCRGLINYHACSILELQSLHDSTFDYYFFVCMYMDFAFIQSARSMKTKP